MPNDMLLKLAAGAILPAIVGFLAILLLVPRRRTQGDERPIPHIAWALPLLLFAAFSLLQPWIAGKFVIVPRSASEWAWPVAAFGLVFSLITAFLPAPGRAQLILRFVLLIGIGALIARTFMGRWTAVEIGAWLGTFAAATFIAGRLLARAATTARGPDGIGVLALFALGAAVACEPGLLSLPSAQFVGILAWTLLGATAAALLRPSLALHHSSASMPLLVSMSIVFAAALTSGDVPLWAKGVYAVMLPAIPGVALLFDRLWPASSDGPRLKRSIARLVVASLPLLVIGGLGAWQAMQEQESGYEY